MGQVVGRIFLIALGFCVSVITAFVMMVLLGGRQISQYYKEDIEGQPPVIDMFIDVLSVVEFIQAIGPALTIVPALLVVIIGEVARIRSSIYYMLAGGVAVVAIPLLYDPTGSGIVAAPSTRFLIIFAATGFVAGFLYWAIAGRLAQGVDSR